ncbi:MAG TPA: cytochrome c oxidase accessory protein CcoG [Azospirillaceae bacterium]|nr:cytochrome c oxidase accessory protein CcoG [Azospirillaceae bacterium]
MAKPARAPAPQYDESDRSQPLYANRIKVYPKSVDGPIRRIKWAVLSLCLAVYYLAPWLRWDRGPGRPGQALLIDMPARRAYVFGLEIWPQEVIYITGLLILGAVALFLVTSLFGRLWCGFACPQTVWTDLFMWAERLIEGDRAQRMRRDRAPLSLDKAWRKAAKHLVWLLIALATGGAWVFYFNDAPTVAVELLTGSASATVYGFVALFAATTYLLAGWAREQVCTYMCPWPRIQAAMVDDRTLTVTYRAWRGEPRGKLKAAAADAPRGDCIDCTACVQVCPTGIDIRNGLQLSCIGCGLCIDACDDIMVRVGRPKGLIAFDTPANEAVRGGGLSLRAHILRPRTFIYALVLGLVAALLVGSLATRSLLEINVLPERSPLFVTLSDGSIQNRYTVKVMNKTPEHREVRIRLTGLHEAYLSVAGHEDERDRPAVLGRIVTVKPDSVGTVHVTVAAPRLALDAASTPVAFVVTAGDGETAVHATHFQGPNP